MKFKTKEDLELPNTGYIRWKYNEGLDDAFKSFAERVEFYKRYRVMPHLLKKEDTEAFNKWVKWANKNELNPWFTREEFNSYDFQCWLFDYCFSDVTDNDTNERL